MVPVRRLLPLVPQSWTHLETASALGLEQGRNRANRIWRLRGHSGTRPGSTPQSASRAASRQLYLPKGEWYDYWTGERIAGEREITRPVDLETVPLMFARERFLLSVQ